MGMLSGEWEDRLAHWIRTLKQDFYEELGEISWGGIPDKRKAFSKRTGEPGAAAGTAGLYLGRMLGILLVQGERSGFRKRRRDSVLSSILSREENPVCL